MPRVLIVTNILESLISALCTNALQTCDLWRKFDHSLDNLLSLLMRGTQRIHQQSLLYVESYQLWWYNWNRKSSIYTWHQLHLSRHFFEVHPYLHLLFLQMFRCKLSRTWFLNTSGVSVTSLTVFFLCFLVLWLLIIFLLLHKYFPR